MLNFGNKIAFPVPVSETPVKLTFHNNDNYIHFSALYM